LFEAHLRGKRERRRQRRLSRVDQEPEPPVGLLAGAEACVLPDRPGSPGVHVAVDAAGIGIAARLTQPRLQIARHVGGGGERTRPVAHVLAPWPSASAPTSTTILPTCWFSFISWCGAGHSSKGNTRDSTGLILPSMISWLARWHW